MNKTPQKPGARKALDAKAEENTTELDEFELTLVVLWNTFSRWVERCGIAARVEAGLSSLDLLLLHFLRYRKRPLRAVDLAFALSIEDLHLVSYSLRKIVKLGLLKSQRSGKEILYSPTPAGDPSYERYLQVRKEHLVDAIAMTKNPGTDLPHLISLLRALSGVYEQAARAAASRP